MDIGADSTKSYRCETYEPDHPSICYLHLEPCILPALVHHLSFPACFLSGWPMQDMRDIAQFESLTWSEISLRLATLSNTVAGSVLCNSLQATIREESRNTPALLSFQPYSLSEHDHPSAVMLHIQQSRERTRLALFPLSAGPRATGCRRKTAVRSQNWALYIVQTWESSSASSVMVVVFP
jgi:hypothetical protein